MISRKWLKTAVMCLMLVMMMAYMADTVYAGADLDERRGIEGLLAGRDDADPDRAPNSTQKFLGIASFGVMIIVVKYL